MAASYLTKSLFVDGMTCPELLWYKVNEKGSLPSYGPSDRAIMEQGTQVGLVAQRCFPGGISIKGSTKEAQSQTEGLLSQRVPLFEATFCHDRLLCKVDVLLPNGEGFDIIEVKSSTKVKDEHLLDVAFQAHVLRQSGVSIENVYVMVINSVYVRNGDLDVEKLFTRQNVTEEVGMLLEKIDADIQRLLQVMDGSKPDLGVYHFCKNPHGCSLSLLTKLPEHNVTEIYYQNGQKFIEQGILRIADITDTSSLNKKQIIQWETTKTGKTHVEKENLQKWFDSLHFPIVHLDFETINPAIPMFEGTSPYEHIPFQFSAHIEREDGTVEHVEFLGNGTDDPRASLCDELCKLPVEGCLLAHNASFEVQVLQRLAKNYPAHADWLTSAINCMNDLIVPFRNFWYYCPEQHGKCSIKYVLPTLTTRSYAELEVSNGGLAQIAYAEMGNGGDHDALKKKLKEYCGLDTEGMVEILRVLRTACQVTFEKSE